LIIHPIIEEGGIGRLPLHMFCGVSAQGEREKRGSVENLTTNCVGERGLWKKDCIQFRLNQRTSHLSQNNLYGKEDSLWRKKGKQGEEIARTQD